MTSTWFDGPRLIITQQGKHNISRAPTIAPQYLRAVNHAAFEYAGREELVGGAGWAGGSKRFAAIG